ncbi:MAG: ABC transporter permease, partial [Planctomycetaceae bacterium]
DEAATLIDATRSTGRVAVLGQPTDLDRAFLAAAVHALADTPELEVLRMEGGPRELRRQLEQLASQGQPLDAIGLPATLHGWPLIADLGSDFPALGQPRVFAPEPYQWPTFLKGDNLLNVANQISEIAIVAIGMTMVIIAGGIDLSVGSLIALSAMTATLLIQDYGGGREASAPTMAICSIAAITLCGVMGLLNGAIITAFHVPAFVVTLGMMLAASGLAGMTTGGEAAHVIPASYQTFASGSVMGLPNAISLMLLLYLLAHLLMSRTALGRYIYAVGGNRLAAHLSGIRTHRVLIFTYVVSALMAGLAGVVMASRLKSGNPTFGKTYELSVIAAVVVGGTSLVGGSGRMFGTLIGAHHHRRHAEQRHEPAQRHADHSHRRLRPERRARDHAAGRGDPRSAQARRPQGWGSVD